VTKFKN